MENEITKVTIEVAKNGFLVYLNLYENAHSYSVKEPYVFQTMAGMQKFVKEQLELKAKIL